MKSVVVGEYIYQNLVRIKRLTELRDDTRANVFTHIGEELGEIARCLRGRKVDEPIEVEIIDLINCAMELYFLSGGKLDEFPDIMSKKLDKWERKINKQ